MAQKFRHRRSKLYLRVKAFTVDLLLVFFLVRMMQETYLQFIHEFFFYLPLPKLFQLTHKINSISVYLILGTMPAYFLLWNYLGNGQTLGKTLMGLKVCPSDDNLRPMNLVESINRSLGYYLCVLFTSLPLLIPFLRDDIRGIPDLVSGTVVLTQDEIRAQLEAQEKALQEVPAEAVINVVIPDEQKKEVA